MHNKVSIIITIFKVDMMANVKIAQYQSKLMETFERYGNYTYDVNVIEDAGVGGISGKIIDTGKSIYPTSTTNGDVVVGSTGGEVQLRNHELLK